METTVKTYYTCKVREALKKEGAEPAGLLSDTPEEQGAHPAEGNAGSGLMVNERIKNSANHFMWLYFRAAL